MAPNVYFGFLQYESFAAIIIGTEINSYSKCVLLQNNLLHSDTVPLRALKAHKDPLFKIANKNCFMFLPLHRATIMIERTKLESTKPLILSF